MARSKVGKSRAKKPAAGSKKPAAARTKKRVLRAKPVAPEDILELRYVGRANISPDGARLVFARRHAGEKNEWVADLWIVDADGRSEAKPFTSGGRDGQPRFSPNGDRVAFVRAKEKTIPQIWVIGSSGGEARALTSFPEGSIRDFAWSPDGRHIAVAFREQDSKFTEAAKKAREEKGLSDPPRVIDDWWYRLDGDGYFNAQRHHLYLVDAESGEHRIVYKSDTLGWFSYSFAPDSKRIAITTNRHPKALIKPWKDELAILDLESGKLRAVPDMPEGPKEQVAWSPDGRWLAYGGRIGGADGSYGTENLELFVCDARRGNARSLTASTDYCLAAAALTDTGEVDFSASLRWTPDSKSILVRLGWHGETHVARAALGGGKPAFLTKGEVDQDLGNISRDGKRVALVRSTATRPPEIFVGELPAREPRELRVRQLTDFNGAWCAARAIAPIKSRWVESDRGVRVQVWEMQPPAPAKAKKKRPAVLEIHGGPHGQYGVGFFHEFQVLASQGYAVFYSNPRGSKGYGRDFCAAIRGAWGTADWVDVQAVTAFIAKHPNVDRKRMGVMGGSYGGYMTNWAIGHTRDFAAAITDRCVSNVVTLGGTSDFVDEPDRYFPGNFWDRPEARWEQSPMKHLGKAKTPTLIIHSEGDLRCNIEQAEQLFNALKLLGVETRFVRYPRSTSHGMSRGGPPDLRIHRLNQIVEWWEKHL